MKITTTIEVKSGGESLVIEFPIRPACILLPEESKHTYRKNCAISDSNTKMIDLMRNFEVFNLEMIDQRELFRGSQFLYKWASNDAFLIYTKIMWTIGLLTNIALAKSIAIQGDSERELTPWMVYHEPWNTIVNKLSLFQVLFCWILLLTWSAYTFQNLVKKNEQKFITFNPSLNKDSPFWSAKIILYDSFVTNPVVTSMFFHIVFCVLAMYASPFFHSFHLLLIINVSPILKDVVRAVTLNFSQILLTLLLLIFLCFMFSIWIIDAFPRQWDDEDDNLNCESLLTCFMFVFNYGLRSGGGIGEAMDAMNKDNDNFTKWTLMEILFWFIINVIGLNIVFGIIVDTFAGLRSEGEKRSSDTKDVCFVCGIHRSEFTKANVDFDKHIREKHDPWKYVYYLFFIKEKGENEMDGVESFIWDQFLRKKCGWLPIGHTRYLDNDDSDEIKELLGKVTALDGKFGGF